MDTMKERNLELKFVVLSSTEDTQVIQKLTDLGVLKIFQKPCKKLYVEEMKNILSEE